jgi:hypothetical protein
MKRRIPHVAVAMAVLLALGNAAQAQSDQIEAAAAANRDLALFVQHSVEKGDAVLGGGFPLSIHHVDELKSATLGTGFPVYTVDARRLVGGESDLHAMSTPTGSWRFIIVEGAQPIGMATVDKVDGHWKTVAYSAAALSQEVNANLAAHGQAAGTHFRFIRVYQAQSDLLEFSTPSAQRPRYALLQSAQRALLAQGSNTTATQAAPLLNIEDFIEPLRSAAQANMAPAR